MDFQIASDLHIEKEHPRIPSLKEYIIPKASRLVLAGDVGRVEHWRQYSTFIRRVCQEFEEVILVAGNHEYYTGDPSLTVDEVDRRLKSLENDVPNLSVLQNTYYSLGKKLIIFGSTYWSELPPKSNLNLPIYSGSRVRMTASYYNMLHYQSRVKLEEMILRSKRSGWRLVVVSHHAPTFRETLAPKYRNNDVKNTLYCSHTDEYLDSQKVSVWIYGHTGHNTDTRSPKGTRVVSNQLEAKDSHKSHVLMLNPF